MGYLNYERFIGLYTRCATLIDLRNLIFTSRRDLWAELVITRGKLEAHWTSSYPTDISHDLEELLKDTLKLIYEIWLGLLDSHALGYRWISRQTNPKQFLFYFYMTILLLSNKRICGVDIYGDKFQTNCFMNAGIQQACGPSLDKLCLL